MLYLATIVGSLTLASVVFVLHHIYVYLQDANGLRKFPGMHPLSPFTNLPYMYFCARGRRYKAVHEAHLKHGSIIRIGPHSVSFSDLQGVREIYGHGTRAFKGSFYDDLAGTHRNLADVSDKADHSRKRRVLAAAYSQAGLESWEHIVADRAGALVDQYDRLCNEPEYRVSPSSVALKTNPSKYKGFINHRYWMIVFTEDAITQIGLSANLHMLEAGHDLVTVEDFKGNKSTFSYREALWYSHRIQSRFVWSRTWFPIFKQYTSWHPGWKHDSNFNSMCVHLVRQRIQRYEAGEKLDDFYTHLFEDKHGKPNMYPIGELVAESSVMLNAGSDTTSIALTNVIYHILKNPACFDKLRSELDAVLSPEDKIAPYDRVKHLPYLRACLDESMRINPPNTMNLPRQPPPEGMSVMGHWIPAGITVTSPPYTVHRNPDIYPEPDVFKPERWLGEEAKNLQPHYLTFSAGARGCIGRNITYLEQTVVVASLVFRYDMELMSKDWVLPQEEAFTCSPGDMPLKIRRRITQT